MIAPLARTNITDTTKVMKMLLVSKGGFFAKTGATGYLNK
jgi:hypothetical protein